jgi:hypothetical protein
MDAVNARKRAAQGRGHHAPASTVVIARVCMAFAVGLCASCATRPAPDIAGHWQPVNRFDAAPVELPLVRPYVFRASAVDRSLRAMLLRWAADAKMTLDYAHPSDFSLYRPVADVGSASLSQAAAALTALYARQRVVVSVDGATLRVRQAGTGVDATPPANASPARSPGAPALRTAVVVAQP